jgi:2-polyprenyl-3-methyl-5-hydroxy-6-metoxy-1,4-benzoquinol methylase
MTDITDELKFKAGVLSRALNDIFTIQKNNLNTLEVTKAHTKEGSWVYIPIHVENVLDTFYAVKEFLKQENKRSSDLIFFNKKFLDAGCGIGNVLLLAHATRLGTEFHGLEYFPETAEAARSFVGLSGTYKLYESIKILEKDITKFNSYGKYDFIYYFHPLQDYAKEAAFEKRVEEQMKVGAILIPKMKRDYSIEKDKRFEKLKLMSGSGVAWRKVKE